MFELENVEVRPMNGTEFKAWCVRMGLPVLHVRRNPRGCYRAYFHRNYGRFKVSVAELSVDGKRVYLRRVGDKGREHLVDTWRTQ